MHFVRSDQSHRALASDVEAGLRAPQRMHVTSIYGRAPEHVLPESCHLNSDIMSSLKDVLPRHLYTNRLTLELYNESQEHIQCLFSCVNNDTARRPDRLGDFGIRTLDDMAKHMRQAPLIDERFAGGKADQAAAYIIREGYHDPSGSLIGAITLAQRRVGDRLIPPDIGWAIVEERMENGFATEAAREALRVYREAIAKDGVTVFASETNWHSNHVAEKLGFTGRCSVPNADDPERPYSLWILPEMARLEFEEGEALSMKDQAEL
jgi:RimJ/RimL family protein N-acetyltransferase